MSARILTGTMACWLLLCAGPLAASCDSGSVRQALPVRDGVLAPLSAELGAGPALPMIQPALLASAESESLALDRVLLRQRLARCIDDEFAGYVPRTEFDNTPYRFNMDSGKRFTADEFDAWMKRRGIRIAKGKAEPEAAAAPEAGTLGAQAAPQPAVVTQQPR